MARQIILASVSPRRREMVKLLNIKFKAIDSGYEEIMHPHLSHGELVEFLALGKAKAAAKKYRKAIIIAADTVVVFNNRAIGKPKNKQENFKMLKSFNNKTQEVFTGVVVIDASAKKIFKTVVKDKIYFKNLTDREIKSYVESGEGLDKAGGYGPLGKGINLIKKLSGDYTTSLGLPLEFVFNALCELKVKV